MQLQKLLSNHFQLITFKRPVFYSVSFYIHSFALFFQLHFCEGALCYYSLLFQDDGLYKNLLQELSQKEGFLFPTYDTIKNGPPHDTTFLSTVEIGGEMFKGGEAKSKKQAEMNAAKAAYTGLTERKELIISSVFYVFWLVMKAAILIVFLYLLFVIIGISATCG